MDIPWGCSQLESEEVPHCTVHRNNSRPHNHHFAYKKDVGYWFES